MADRFVVDASVVLCWCFDDEAPGYGDAVLGRLEKATAVAPAVWPLEVTNGLLVARARGRIDRAGAARFLQLLSGLPIAVKPAPTSRVFAEVYALAGETGLTAYDASYLDLAQREGLALATLDDPLRKAARRCEVMTYDPAS